MSLRRAGGSTLRLLRVYAAAAGGVHGEQLRVLQALPSVTHHLLQLQQHPSSAGQLRWDWHGSPHQLELFRHLAASAPEQKDSGRGGTQPPGPPASPLPGAQDCDEAIEQYERTRTSYKNLAPPSTYRTASQRVWDVLAGTAKMTIAILGWCASVPGKLWGLTRWSRDDWSRWWASVKKVTKDEAHHYWVGFKLLAFDVRVSSGLVLKAMRGSALTRRERKQLTRTTADMFRLVPMIIILVIPFMELALPILLKLFPNMLPSTFEDKLKKEEEVKKRLLVKMEVAKFLQDTVAEMAKDIKAKRTGEMSATAAELYTFINRVRAGAEVSNDELVKFASLFNDELTLDNLDRVQLVSMCQLLGIPPFGTDSFIKGRLRAHLDGLKQDDLLIRSEGLDSLTDDELRTACRSRGMKAAFGSGATMYMRRQMNNWLDLSLNRGLPSSLLLLSRAFTLTSPIPAVAAGAAGAADDLGRVKETLLTLPEEVIEDVSLEVAAPATGAEELQKRLRLMQKEQKLIQEEAKQAVLEAASSQPAVMAGAHLAPHPAAAAAGAADDATQAAAAQHAAAVAAATAVLSEASASALRDVMAAEGISEEQRNLKVAEAREERMQQLLYAITVLASSSGVATERAKFMDLVRQQVKTLQDTHGHDTTTLTFTGGSLQAVRPEDAIDSLAQELVAPLRLEERVNGILLRLEKELDQADKDIGERLHVLDLDNDGLITQKELTEALSFLKANLDEQDLLALLDRLEIKAEGRDMDTISVADLIKLAETAAAKEAAGGVAAVPAAAAAATAGAKRKQQQQQQQAEPVLLKDASAVAPGSASHMKQL